MAAAQRFFRGAVPVTGKIPHQVTSDDHDSYPRAVREALGPQVEHRCNAYLNRRIEQDHRGVKQRYYPMLGFGGFRSAQRFCRAFEEVRQYFRPRRKQEQSISLAQRRRRFIARAQVSSRCSWRSNQQSKPLSRACTNVVVSQCRHSWTLLSISTRGRAQGCIPRRAFGIKPLYAKGTPATSSNHWRFTRSSTAKRKSPHLRPSKKEDSVRAKIAIAAIFATSLCIADHKNARDTSGSS